MANATGCSSVFASTFPFNPYNDPWVNSLFQDSPALSKGIFEGLTAAAVEDFRALRVAKLDLDDHYNPTLHDPYFKYFRWAQFTDEELALMPTLISMGGDGATYDIGFGALSRLLTTDTPIKIVVLNSGAYSNTGGQSSTASFTAQDSDLARFGSTHRGKQEDRKELGLIASFHPKVYVTQTSTAFQNHFMKSLMEFLTYNDSPSLLDVYTPCQPEHGISDAASYRNARLAVESRMSPLFVHDPRRGEATHEWFSLDGNPDVTKDWTSRTIEYVDTDGSAKLMELALTPADFAFEEGRFKRHFTKLSGEPNEIPIDEFIDLGDEERAGKIPFICATDDDMHLVKYGASATIVELVDDRRKAWRRLQYLSGLDMDALGTAHRVELEHWRKQYDESVAQRESSIDSIAQAMSELAAASNAPGIIDLTSLMSGPSPSLTMAPGKTAVAPSNGAATALVSITDMTKCTNCKTCYQDMSELFEKTKIMVDGESKEVARIIPGAVEKITVTPELIAKAQRAAANCDAEIIRCGS
jgi:pyruvate-ferredoxin/flavodoxin oxidoreductase